MSFSNDVKRWAKKANRTTGEILRGASISLFNDIITATPVDTGRLVGNWQVTFDAPASTSLNIDHSTKSEVALRTANVISNHKFNDDVEVYFTNNLPYAVAIEEGHGANNAPGGMVRSNVIKWRTKVRRAAQ